MPRYFVRLLWLSSWEKEIVAKSPAEAEKKAEWQADSWERKRWVHCVNEASAPEVQEVNKDDSIL